MFSKRFLFIEQFLHACAQRPRKQTPSACAHGQPAVDMRGLQAQEQQTLQQEAHGDETFRLGGTAQESEPDGFVGVSRNVVDDWLHHGTDLADMTFDAYACHITKVARTKLNSTTQFSFASHYPAAVASVTGNSAQKCCSRDQWFPDTLQHKTQSEMLSSKTLLFSTIQCPSAKHCAHASHVWRQAAVGYLPNIGKDALLR